VYVLYTGTGANAPLATVDNQMDRMLFPTQGDQQAHKHECDSVCRRLKPHGAVTLFPQRAGDFDFQPTHPVRRRRWRSSRIDSSSFSVRSVTGSGLSFCGRALGLTVASVAGGSRARASSRPASFKA
jgi:hypothetical protein